MTTRGRLVRPSFLFVKSLSRPSTELLLVNLGTPAEASEEAVRTFLREFLSDPMVVDRPARWLWLPILHGIVLRRRPAAVAEAYRSIWSEEGSPLAVQTQAIAAASAERLGESVRVTAAYRYGSPGLASHVEEAAARAKRVVVVPLVPHPTASSSGTIARVVESAGERLGLGERLRYRTLPPDDPGYVDALVERYHEVWSDAEAPERLLFSFHGIPERVDRYEHRIYSKACERTVAAVLERLQRERDEGILCYQSRFGREPWLGPATVELLERLPHEGIRDLAVFTPGFLTEGLETLEEIGERGRRSFEEAGGRRFTRVPAVADHPALIGAIAQLIES